MNLFITATDTEVGKTVVSAWLALHLKASYFKPIQTGACAQRDSKEVFRLSRAPIIAESYLFQKPLSPLAAAELEGRKINLSHIQKPFCPNLIIEGAGGLFVPLTSRFFMIDLIKKLKSPVIVVARTTLGTINHSCLTLEALRRRNIPVVGVILNGSKNEKTKRLIEKCGKVSVLDELEPFKILSYSQLKRKKPSAKLLQAIDAYSK